MSAHDRSKKADIASTKRSLLGKSAYEDDVFHMTVHPDGFRFAGYSLLVALLAIGFIITSIFNMSEDSGKWRHVSPTNNTLFKHFGYNNACLYIDDLPAKYIALWVATLFIVCWSAYLGLSLVSYYLSEKKGRISRSFYNWCKASVIIDFVLVTYFIECFGVHPDENFIMHTIPFTCLIISVCITGIRNVLFENQVVDFTDHPIMRIVQKCYLVGLIITTILKLLVQFFGIILLQPPSPALGQLSDQLWMLFALALPWIKSGCAAYMESYDTYFPRMSGFDDNLSISIRNPLLDEVPGASSKVNPLPAACCTHTVLTLYSYCILILHSHCTPTVSTALLTALLLHTHTVLLRWFRSPLPRSQKSCCKVWCVYRRA
jgi:hypothetical protein